MIFALFPDGTVSSWALREYPDLAFGGWMYAFAVSSAVATWCEPDRSVS